MYLRKTEKIIYSITLGLKIRFFENTTPTQSINPVAIEMNLIAQYEQGYLSLSNFVYEFPDSISESQEALYGEKCVEFYVAVTLGKTDCRYYVQVYGGDCYENDERLYIEDTCTQDEQDPFDLFNP